MFNRGRKLACSFCGKRDFEVEKLVAGCVELLVRAEDAARADEVLRTAPAPPLSA
jgi:hypothetical protein